MRQSQEGRALRQFTLSTGKHSTYGVDVRYDRINLYVSGPWNLSLYGFHSQSKKYVCGFRSSWTRFLTTKTERAILSTVKPENQMFSKMLCESLLRPLFFVGSLLRTAIYLLNDSVKELLQIFLTPFFEFFFKLLEKDFRDYFSKEPVVDLFPRHVVQNLQELQGLPADGLEKDMILRLKQSIENIVKDLFLKDSISPPVKLNVVIEAFLKQSLNGDTKNINKLIRVYQNMRAWNGKSRFYRQILLFVKEHDFQKGS